MKHLLFAVLIDAFAGLAAVAGILDRGPTRMMCHRTAGRDIPENTLESLAFASRMGCSVVEVDLRLTLDHEVVLNHDGLLERLTNGMGEVETSYFEELEMLDAGSWMNGRFSGSRIPRFVDALHLANERGIGLVLDLKDKEMGTAVLPMLRREGMLERVRFGGEWADVRDAYSAANGDATVGIEPPVTEEAVRHLHSQGKSVIANFSANGYEMDISAMRTAVAAGVDWINVDYPRLGADAIGSPVEAKIVSLLMKAKSANSSARATAVLELAHYDGFPLQSAFRRWLLDSDDEVSRAAAVALLTVRPAAPVGVFLSALAAKERTARKNAAWAIGMLSSPVAESLIPLLSEKDAGVLQEALLAISRCGGNVPANRLQPFLTHTDPLVRGAAALALARHQPDVAAEVIPIALAGEEASIAKDYELYVQRGKPRLSQSEIDITVGLYRCLMKMIESGGLLRERAGTKLFEREAFRSALDYSSTVGPVAGYQLWDRIAVDPTPAIEALASDDIDVANRAEWTLTKAGAAVLPAVRRALSSASKPARERAIRILAWQEDAESLPSLRALRTSNAVSPALIDWAVEKIQTFASSMP